MKYIANPVTVEAYKIASVRRDQADDYHCTLSNGQVSRATREMVSRFIPGPGDYWVIQGDGYAYLNPAAVFERKYSPVPAE